MMRKIRKNTEPVGWRQYRKTPNVSYQAIPDLRIALYKEQGGICAYCMKRLQDEIEVGCRGLVAQNRVEHIKCRERYKSLSLVYNNMVLCCNGITTNGQSSGKKKEDREHCDVYKGQKDMEISPLSSTFIASLSYSKDGTIKSSNDNWNSDIKDVLNLNHNVLKQNRASIRSGIEKMILSRRISKRDLKKQIDSWSSRDSDGLFKENCEVAVFILNKYLKKGLITYNQ